MFGDSVDVSVILCIKEQYSDAIFVIESLPYGSDGIKMYQLLGFACMSRW